MNTTESAHEHAVTSVVPILYEDPTATLFLMAAKQWRASLDGGDGNYLQLGSKRDIGRNVGPQQRTMPGWLNIRAKELRDQTLMGLLVLIAGPVLMKMDTFVPRYLMETMNSNARNSSYSAVARPIPSTVPHPTCLWGVRRPVGSILGTHRLSADGSERP